jgi:alpha-1,3-glucosyltransferase
MALYYASAIGSYLLAKCLHLGPTNGKGQAHLIRLGIVTATSFLLLFAPFLPPFSPVTSILDPISRIFPFGRGLFEDKVANFWCASNVVLKWRNWASSALLIRMSAALTALGFLPAVVGMLVTGWNLQVEEKPIVGASSGIINSSNSNNKGVNDGAETPTQTKLSMATAAAAALSAASSSTSNQSEPAPALQLLPYALLTSAMSFFLFSFQVHEKTILLPLMPLALLLSGAAPSSAVYEWGMLVSNAAVFSMWPLLKKDGLGLQYAATLMLWNRLMGYDVLSFLRWPKSFVGLLALVRALLAPLCSSYVSKLTHLTDLLPYRTGTPCAGGGHRPASTTTGPLSGAQCASVYADIRTGVVVEHQAWMGGTMGTWWAGRWLVGWE